MGELLKEAEDALRKLLACPAIADGNHNEPAWRDEETVEAESEARAVLARLEAAP